MYIIKNCKHLNISFCFADIENKLKDVESMKNIADGRKKLAELEVSIQNSEVHLEKLQKYKKKKEKRKNYYEKQIKEQSSKVSKSNDSSNSTDREKNPDDSKALALISPLSQSDTDNSKAVLLSNEKMEFLRHEIRNLRKTREFLIDQKLKIDAKSQNKKILSDVEERKLLQYEEATEAIDWAIEFKNEILCGHRPVSERALEKIDDQGDKLLMDRLMKLSENEMRMLLHKYFQKVSVLF